MSKVIFLCDFELPLSCANATRVWNLASMLVDKYEVDVIGVAYRAGLQLDGSYKGISYKMIQAPMFSGLRAAKRIRCLDNNIKSILEKEIAGKEIKAIVLSNFYFDHASTLINFSKIHNIPLIVNSVEWYEKDNSRFDGLLGKIRYAENRIALTYYHVRMKNILAISSLLSDYYKSKGCKTITIPTVVDILEYKDVHYDSTGRDGIVIAYAGSPARKDYIGNAILALSYLDERDRKLIQLHFYGADKESFIKAGIEEQIFEKYKDNIICHGRIPYESVKTAIGKADFTILLRPNKRYANAGFPTKVGESMACGTPVIGNVTSDLGNYYVDGENAIVCDDESPEACARAMKRCIALSPKEILLMRASAKKTADQYFNYKQYAKSLVSFIEESGV